MRCRFLLIALAMPGLACTIESPEASGAHMVVNAVSARGASVGFLEAQPGLPRAVWRAPSGVTVDLGTLPGGLRSSAVAIDDAGTIVGQSETARGSFRAVRWRRGVIEDLGTLPGGDFSVASAIAGDVVLGESDARDGLLHAFRWQNGRMTDLGPLNPAAATDVPRSRSGPR